MLNAEAVVKIQSDHYDFESFKLNYFVDTSGNMSLEELKDQDFTEGKNKISLGINSNVTWVKFVLKNETPDLQKICIQNIYAFHASSIHYFELNSHGEVIQEINYEPRNNINTDLMDGAIAPFKIELKPKEETIIYMRSHFLAYQIIDLQIFDQKQAKENLIGEYVPIVVLMSMLLTLSLYYILLFFISGHREYIYYALYLASSSIFIGYSYGMLTHYFHIYGIFSLYLNATVLISPVFLALFIKVIFNTKKKYFIENMLLDTIVVIFALAYIYSFFDYYFTMELATYIYIYLLIVMLVVGISLYRKNVALITYFIVAHVFYIVFTFVALLYYNGEIDFNYFTSHAVAIGTTFEAFLLGFLVSYRIRVLEESNHQKDQMILTDMMTNLYNKSYFEEALNDKLRIQQKEKNILALLIIDIDYFKQYNDVYGHVAGDEALKEVAAVLKNTLIHTDDMAFRVGGEEFAIICMNTNKNKILTCAKNIQKNIENLKLEHEKSDVSQYLTVSIGIHFASTQVIENARKVYEYADKALYAAKRDGRDKIEVYGDITKLF
jgi:diguanylate cyclase (GGDEF)-like protein